jgi:hypothetical protein
MHRGEWITLDPFVLLFEIHAGCVNRGTVLQKRGGKKRRREAALDFGTHFSPPHLSHSPTFVVSNTMV